jgi:hypothetical protein
MPALVLASWNLFASRTSVLVRDTVFHVSLESKQLKMDEIFSFKKNGRNIQSGQICIVHETSTTVSEVLSRSYSH